MKTYTTKELCQLLKKTRQDLAHHAKKLGVKKFGNVFCWTEKDVEMLKKLLRNT